MKKAYPLINMEIKAHPKSVNTIFGFVPQDSYYPEPTARENLASMEPGIMTGKSFDHAPGITGSPGINF
jgi:hypothetical protein